MPEMATNPHPRQSHNETVRPEKTLFLVLEGGEGSGKSTQAKLLYRRLQYLKLDSILVRDPGGTSTGRSIERWLKHSRYVPPSMELLLFGTARALLCNDMIKPALEAGMIVICDRYAPSTTAYQGYGRRLDMKTVEYFNDLATDGLQPDLSILLDIPPEDGLARKSKLTDDRFQRESLAFHHRVRNGYLELADSNPGQWLVLDATMPRATLQKQIWESVRARLPR